MFKIAIPSYNREQTITKKTISVLIRYNIDPRIVYIFLADESQKQKYLVTLPKEFHSRIFLNHCYGIKDVRNFMNDFFDEGENIFFLDDDIEELYYLNESKLQRIESLYEFIKLGFKLCYIKECKMFCIYPVENPYFMKNSIQLGLTYGMAGVMGLINRKSLKVSVADKEDFERSILYFMDCPKGIIRFNNVCARTRCYKNAGGMQSFDRSYNVVLEASEIIIKKYPKYAKLNLKKKSGKPEIKLKNIKYEEIKL